MDLGRSQEALIYHKSSSKNCGHPNHWSLTYDGHINENLCGDLFTLVMVCFLWHNLNCCKFIMPWPRYRMNSCWLLKWFKCILQVIRVLDAHIKGEPILCLVSLRLTFSSSDLCSHLVRMSFSWVRYINSIQIGKVIFYIQLDCNFIS
jgi:hypothetical protein